MISAGEVLNPANAALRDPVTIRFTGPGTWEALDATSTVLGTGAYVPGGNIEFNGWRVNISGQPATGDSFQVAGNSSGVGDNRNALEMVAALGRGLDEVAKARHVRLGHRTAKDIPGRGAAQQAPDRDGGISQHPCLPAPLGPAYIVMAF